MRFAIILLTLTSVLAAPVENEDAVQEFITGHYEFIAAIYKETVKQSPGNLIVSPFSVQAILALLLEGARGPTAAELIDGIRFPSTKEATQEAYQQLLPKLTSTTDESLKISVANKIYLENGIELLENFRSVATDVYGSGVENVEFRDSQNAAAEINNWVEEQTNHKIQDLVSPDALPEQTVAVLVNTVYLNGQWSLPFVFHPTEKQEFFISEDESVSVDTMHSEEGAYRFYENQELDAKFLELPLLGGDVSFGIVLPNQRDGLAALEQKIEQVLVPQPFTYEEIILDLPRFSVESQIEFVPVLQSLGIERLFNSLADLSRISPNAGVYVSDIVQKAFINVTETGIEAAAATEVVIVTAEPVNPVHVKVDHPFLYYIKDNGILLFYGRFVNP